MPQERCGVEVIERKTGKVIHFVACRRSDRRSVTKVEEGMRISMNHKDYYTRKVGLKG